MQKYITPQKTPSKIKKPKSFKIYYNSITNNFKFQLKPKYHVSKILILKIGLLLLLLLLLLLPWGQNPLSYYTLY